MNADILRKKFLDFFKSKKHKIVESDSLVPGDDPTVLFTPAGMNQFKKEFLGLDSGFKRAATSQRCLRTDDLDKVGKTAVHHTFFEMLGNFSFGDYFKEEAIAWAWEFLTEELKIKKEKLWVSVYKEDDEAYKIWEDKIKIPAVKIVKLGDKENFWPSEAKAKGPNGPCGPCSEIFFDWGKDTGCGSPKCDPSCSCGRFSEIWNLVFTQFNRQGQGLLEPLPKKNIDTGMGLERLTAVMQGVESNFETDLFKPIVDEVIREVKIDALDNRELIYAVVDHVRAIVFCIFDGVLPSNESRGYIVRKLIRKCVLHLRALGVKQPFLYKLVPLVCALMKKPYPDLEARKENIAQVILAEEKSFISSLNASDTLFKDRFSELSKRQDPVLAGEIAFHLYDTHGIPLELTKGWLDRHAIKISEEAFNKQLNVQKARSKLQSTMKGDVFATSGLHLSLAESKFLGYKEFSAKSKLVKIIKDGAPLKISKGDEAVIILDKTCFYAEAGGQVGDTGEILKGKNIFEVLDTQKTGNVITNIGRVKAGSFRLGDAVTAKINMERRQNIARNHTATHILQAALIKVLGEHVKQQGSLVATDRLRFDFTHFKDINDDELNRIEEVVNNYVLQDTGLHSESMLLAEAKKTGAKAFFGEKYESKVRVVSIGDFSKELCGGTHLDSAGQIGLFKIVNEGSVASGIRRIEAVTGAYAYKKVKEEEAIIADISKALNVPKERILTELANRLSKVKELEKQLHSHKLDMAKGSVDAFIEKAQEVNGIKLITEVLENADADFLRSAVDLIKQRINNCVIALGGKGKDKALLVIGLTADLVSKGLDASKLILKPAVAIGGSGGGRKDFALGGGSKPGNFTAAFNELKGLIK